MMSALVLVLLLLSEVVTPFTFQDCPESTNIDAYVDQHEDKCYYFHLNKRENYQAARTFCEAKGQKLLTIESQNEQDFILNEVKNTYNQKEKVWVGLREFDGNNGLVNSAHVNSLTVDVLGKMNIQEENILRPVLKKRNLTTVLPKESMVDAQDMGIVNDVPNKNSSSNIPNMSNSKYTQERSRLKEAGEKNSQNQAASFYKRESLKEIDHGGAKTVKTIIFLALCGEELAFCVDGNNGFDYKCKGVFFHIVSDRFPFICEYGLLENKHSSTTTSIGPTGHQTSPKSLIRTERPSRSSIKRRTDNTTPSIREFRTTFRPHSTIDTAAAITNKNTPAKATATKTTTTTTTINSPAKSPTTRRKTERAVPPSTSNPNTILTTTSQLEPTILTTAKHFKTISPTTTTSTPKSATTYTASIISGIATSNTTIVNATRPTTETKTTRTQTPTTTKETTQSTSTSKPTQTTTPATQTKSTKAPTCPPCNLEQCGSRDFKIVRMGRCFICTCDPPLRNGIESNFSILGFWYPIITYFIL